MKPHNKATFKEIEDMLQLKILIGAKLRQAILNNDWDTVAELLENTEYEAVNGEEPGDQPQPAINIDIPKPEIPVLALTSAQIERFFSSLLDALYEKDQTRKPIRKWAKKSASGELLLPATELSWYDAGAEAILPRNSFRGAGKDAGCGQKLRLVCAYLIDKLELDYNMWADHIPDRYIAKKIDWLNWEQDMQVSQPRQEKRPRADKLTRMIGLAEAAGAAIPSPKRRREDPPLFPTSPVPPSFDPILASSLRLSPTRPPRTPALPPRTPALPCRTPALPHSSSAILHISPALPQSSPALQQSPALQHSPALPQSSPALPQSSPTFPRPQLSMRPSLVQSSQNSFNLRLEETNEISTYEVTPSRRTAVSRRGLLANFERDESLSMTPTDHSEELNNSNISADQEVTLLCIVCAVQSHTLLFFIIQVTDSEGNVKDLHEGKPANARVSDINWDPKKKQYRGKISDGALLSKNFYFSPDLTNQIETELNRSVVNVLKLTDLSIWNYIVTAKKFNFIRIEETIGNPVACSENFYRVYKKNKSGNTTPRMVRNPKQFL